MVLLHQARLDQTLQLRAELFCRVPLIYRDVRRLTKLCFATPRECLLPERCLLLGRLSGLLVVALGDTGILGLSCEWRVLPHHAHKVLVQYLLIVQLLGHHCRLVYHIGRCRWTGSRRLIQLDPLLLVAIHFLLVPALFLQDGLMTPLTLSAKREKPI